MLAGAHRRRAPALASRQQPRRERRDQPRGDHRALAGARGADDAEQAGLDGARGELADQRLAAEEQARVVVVERGEAHVGAGCDIDVGVGPGGVETLEAPSDHVVGEREVGHPLGSARGHPLGGRLETTARLLTGPQPHDLVHAAGRATGGADERLQRHVGALEVDVLLDDAADAVVVERRDTPFAVAALVDPLDERRERGERVVVPERAHDHGRVRGERGEGLLERRDRGRAHRVEIVEDEQRRSRR